MRKLLVFQHVPFEPLGTLNPLVKRAGFRVRYVNFGRSPKERPGIQGYHGLIVLGGPMNVDQVDRYPHLRTEIELIQEAIQEGIPILGICLGAQLIAKALGAKVKKNPEKEIGWYDILLTETGRKNPLFRHFCAKEKIFQWHGDTFEIPQEAIHLASSPNCANQAFQYQDRVYGLQFHLEVDEALIERWLTIPIHRQELEELKGTINPEVIRQETAAYIHHSKELSEQTFGEFIQLFGEIRKKHVVLPSR